MLQNILFVGLGGAAGSILRYLLGVWLQPTEAGGWPAGTFLANVAGCLLIGMLSGYAVQQSESSTLRLLLISGFCGGFTTFSTFSNEAIQLFKDGYLTTALTYIGSTVLFCLIGTYIGYALLGNSQS